MVRMTRSWEAGRRPFIGDCYDATRHVNMITKPAFRTPVSSVGYALIICCGGGEIEAALA
jgi:hypothetical protein